MRPITSLITNPPQLVSELITANANWDVPKINQIFLPTDVEAIISIPLCTWNINDFWSWAHEKSGSFTIRSAYRMLVSTKHRREAWLDGRAGSSDGDGVKKAWTKLWKIDVPLKIKVFLWRLAHQSLPTADILNHRNMSTSSTCGLCGSADSWQHSLLHCNMARCVWGLEDPDLVSVVESITEPDAKRWVFPIMDALPPVISLRY